MAEIEKPATKIDRRDFLKLSAITGVVAFGAFSSDKTVLNALETTPVRKEAHIIASFRANGEC